MVLWMEVTLESLVFGSLRSSRFWVFGSLGVWKFGEFGNSNDVVVSLLEVCVLEITSSTLDQRWVGGLCRKLEVTKVWSLSVWMSGSLDVRSSRFGVGSLEARLTRSTSDGSADYY